VHHLLAAAAVAGSDWRRATAGLNAVQRCVAEQSAALLARSEGLRAEVALGEHRIEAALDHAATARSAAVRAGRRELESDALTLLGRGHRAADLDAAERFFAAAFSIAELSGSALRCAHALEELATIDVVRVGETDRVLKARRHATEIGAPGRAAVIDLQLAVLHFKRYELDAAREAARRAGHAGERFGLGLLVRLWLIVIGGVIGSGVQTSSGGDVFGAGSCPGGRLNRSKDSQAAGWLGGRKCGQRRSGGRVLAGALQEFRRTGRRVQRHRASALLLLA
jgi:hypothetical protein